MKRNVFAAILLGMATTLAVQASFADESSLMENRMVQLNQHAIEQASSNRPRRQPRATPMRRVERRLPGTFFFSPQP
ncbi:hypothetical protein BH77_18530 [Pseudomonas aeruginosa C2773C]|nr:hypothetical protein BH77_18530 [Pseudomonas aeruginosa C2773C]SQK97342.1 Uncharacterised protein [Pseudomonas aeruginosa]